METPCRQTFLISAEQAKYVYKDISKRAVDVQYKYTVQNVTEVLNFNLKNYIKVLLIFNYKNATQQVTVIINKNLHKMMGTARHNCW